MMQVTKSTLLILVVFGCQLAYSASLPTPTEIVTTNAGRVQGLLDNGISAFKGIPYGAPPVAELRFMPPKPVEKWNMLLDATSYGASAVQMYDRFGETEVSRQIATLFTTQSEMKTDNEDCLFLNIWTPAPDQKKRPVMIWFHGGGWSYGSGSWPVYDGVNLARKGDVVVVTVNHRLNVFGYLHLAEIGGDKYKNSGNAGLLDMVLSLEWVRDNIAAFGGDPNNVTIMGESGGGSKVSHLMATPRAKGLFHKAIIQSGPALEAVEADHAKKNTKAILAELNIDENNLAQLHTLHADVILKAAQAAQAKNPGYNGLRFSPVIDGDSLPTHPFAPGAPKQSRDVPLMIGWNKDEMTIFNVSAPWFGQLTEEQLMQRAGFMFKDKAQELVSAYKAAHPDYSPSYLFSMMSGDQYMFVNSVIHAERKAAQGGAPAYMYYLLWDTPAADGIFKSTHTLEIPFMFNNVDRSQVLTGDNDEARALENQMASSWLAFAKTGNPSNDTIGQWPAYDAQQRATMVFDVKSRVENNPKGKLLEIFRR
ncbi:MAG: carboxylesterase/lipase family protein [Pseudomonadota bacterium]